MSDVLHEVEEEYRREQAKKLWEKYRVPIVGAAAAIILGVAGFQGYNYWRAEQVEQSSRDFEAIQTQIAQNPGSEKASVERLTKLADDGTAAYATAARFQLAAIKAEGGDFKGAVALYDALAKDAMDGLFRDYARLRAATLLVESAKAEEIETRLAPLTGAKGTWQGPALEILAYSRWRAGRSAEALKLYKQIQDIPGIPDGTRRRAMEMSALIGSGVKPSDVKPPTAPAPSVPSLLLPPQIPGSEPPGILPGSAGPATPPSTP